MAGDWVKVRVWLEKDPKVISIADYLSVDRAFMNWATSPVQRSCKESVYEHWTRDVTVRVTVTGLVRVWGVTREDGNRQGDDLVIEKTGLDTLDEIAGFPGLGEAMAYVGWAVEDEENHRVILPKFFARNADNDDLRREKDRERKRLQRQKQAASASADSSAERPRNSAPREEKRREEKSKKKSPPIFVPPTVEQVAEYCRERGNTVDPAAFVDFYASKGWMIGKNPMRDWKAAVRTWEKNEGAFRSNGKAAKPGHLFDGIEEFRRRHQHGDA